MAMFENQQHMNSLDVDVSDVSTHAGVVYQNMLYSGRGEIVDNASLFMYVS